MSKKFIFSFLILFIVAGFLVSLIPFEAIASGGSVTFPTSELDPLNVSQITSSGSEPYRAISVVIGRIIKALLGVVGAVAVLMIVYGGMMILTAAGSPEKVKKGKDVLTWAIIGAIVVLSSYIMVDYVITAIITGGSGGSPGGGNGGNGGGTEVCNTCADAKGQCAKCETYLEEGKECTKAALEAYLTGYTCSEIDAFSDCQGGAACCSTETSFNPVPVCTTSGGEGGNSTDTGVACQHSSGSPTGTCLNFPCLSGNPSIEEASQCTRNSLICSEKRNCFGQQSCSNNTELCCEGPNSLTPEQFAIVCPHLASGGGDDCDTDLGGFCASCTGVNLSPSCTVNEIELKLRADLNEQGLSCTAKGQNNCLASETCCVE